MKIEVKGPIISSNEQWIYDWFDIEATSPKKVSEVLKKADGEDIIVEINSGGGLVFAGSEIYTILKDYKGNVTVKIVGIAASAASVVAMAGSNVLMSPTAQMMIHNSRGGVDGDYRDMEKGAEILKSINKSISNAYRLKTGLGKEDLLSLMDKETWMTSEEALENGFIDEIMFEKEFNLVASTDVNGMLPPEVINKLRNEFRKKPKETDDKKEKRKTIENTLKELDLILTLR